MFPQGFYPGSLLFLLYINDLQCVFSKSILNYLDDDTDLLFPSKKLGTADSIINNGLNHLAPWSRETKLLLNETKTKLTTFR